MKRASGQPASDHAHREARHPIAVVATRTGLSPDVLRVWERRYAAVKPGRSRDGQRLYSDADVERLRALRHAIDAGRSIGQVARLPSAALRKLLAEDAAARTGEQPRGATAAANELVAEALVHIRALDAQALETTLRRAATLMGVRTFLEDLAAPLLRRVGDEWHAARLSVAQEHLASSVLQEVMMSAMRGLASGNAASRIVVATPAGERHAAGAALVGARAAANGWNVVYLGADVPAEDLASAALATNARAVALSVVFVDDRRPLIRELRSLRERLPGEVALIVGGAGAGTLRDELRSAGIQVAETLGELDRITTVS
jgi:methanogenic corrinoid protein MtbC1